MVEQALAHPRIFRQDHIHLAKDADRPEGHVFQIADRGRDHIQHQAAGLFVMTGSAEIPGRPDSWQRIASQWGLPINTKIGGRAGSVGIPTKSG